MEVVISGWLVVRGALRHVHDLLRTCSQEKGSEGSRPGSRRSKAEVWPPPESTFHRSAQAALWLELYLSQFHLRERTWLFGPHVN